MKVAPEDYEATQEGGLEKDRYMKISLKLLTMMRESLAKFLKKNVDLLAWKPEDMPCIK